MYNLKELSTITSNMKLFGGSFAVQLATLMEKADFANLQIIVEAWPMLMAEYSDPKWDEVKD